MKLKIKKGDIVQVSTGVDKGKTGRVMLVYPKKMKILVEGVNIQKKHTRPTQADPKGGIKSKEMPIDYSNVMMLDSDKNPTRIGIKIQGEGKKKQSIRYAKTNQKDL